MLKGTLKRSRVDDLSLEVPAAKMIDIEEKPAFEDKNTVPCASFSCNEKVEKPSLSMVVTDWTARRACNFDSSTHWNDIQLNSLPKYMCDAYSESALPPSSRYWETVLSYFHTKETVNFEGNGNISCMRNEYLEYPIFTFGEFVQIVDPANNVYKLTPLGEEWCAYAKESVSPHCYNYVTLSKFHRKIARQRYGVQVYSIAPIDIRTHEVEFSIAGQSMHVQRYSNCWFKKDWVLRVHDEWNWLDCNSFHDFTMSGFGFRGQNKCNFTFQTPVILDGKFNIASGIANLLTKSEVQELNEGRKKRLNLPYGAFQYDTSVGLKQSQFLKHNYKNYLISMAITEEHCREHFKNREFSILQSGSQLYTHMLKFIIIPGYLRCENPDAMPPVFSLSNHDPACEDLILSVYKIPSGNETSIGQANDRVQLTSRCKVMKKSNSFWGTHCLYCPKCVKQKFSATVHCFSETSSYSRCQEFDYANYNIFWEVYRALPLRLITAFKNQECCDVEIKFTC